MTLKLERKTEHVWLLWKSFPEKAYLKRNGSKIQVNKVKSKKKKKHKICGTKTFRQRRPKWRCLTISLHVLEYQYNLFKPTVTTAVKGWLFGLVLHPQDLNTLQWLSQSRTLLYTKCEGICVTARAVLKLHHATALCSKA